MARVDNLKNTEGTQFKSGQEAVENGRKGGIASGEAKRRKKTYAELAAVLGDRKVSGKNADKLKEMGYCNADQTNDALAVARIYQGMLQGNPKMTELWLKLRGEYPKEDAQNLNLTVSEGSQVVKHLHLPDDGMEDNASDC